MTAPPTEATRSMTSSPRFLQGVFAFEGRGLASPFLLDESMTYTVPRDREAQLVYFRAGNASGALVYAVIMRDGSPMRYFPIGAQASTHVPLRVVEGLLADTRLELFVGAPAGPGQIVVDLGLVEI
jgi:assimilatory nitrate reductase catalytic subunit